MSKQYCVIPLTSYLEPLDHRDRGLSGGSQGQEGGSCHLPSVKSRVCEGIGCVTAGMFLTRLCCTLANGEDGKLDVMSILL